MVQLAGEGSRWGSLQLAGEGRGGVAGCRGRGCVEDLGWVFVFLFH